MPGTVPNKEELTALVGEPLYAVWNQLCTLIDEKYDMDRLWNHGGKAWKYEYKYRRGRQNAVRAVRKRKLCGFYGHLRKR